VVDGVLMLPLDERGKHEESEERADATIGATRWEQRAVRTVVEDHEGADQKGAGGDDEQDCQ
jgi:hypothetical protein